MNLQFSSACATWWQVSHAISLACLNTGNNLYIVIISLVECYVSMEHRFEMKHSCKPANIKYVLCNASCMYLIIHMYIGHCIFRKKYISYVYDTYNTVLVNKHIHWSWGLGDGSNFWGPPFNSLYMQGKVGLERRALMLHYLLSI